MKRSCLVLLLATGALGCAATSPWPAYETALRCHLDGKKDECDQHYKAAIKADPKVQGIHASYATHLLLTGRMQEAQKEYAIEERNYPMFATVGIGRITGRTPAGPAAPAEGMPPAPAPAPAAPGSAPASPAGSAQGVAQ